MSNQVSLVPSLEDLLSRSQATESFKAAARGFAARGDGNGHINASPSSPPVKVLRALQQLLDSHPHLPLASVSIEGRSGCSDYRGTIEARLEDGSLQRFRFVWDCAWKARQEGMKTFWGDPDQQKAAQTFGYRCFEVFEPAQ